MISRENVTVPAGVSHFLYEGDLVHAVEVAIHMDASGTIDIAHVTFSGWFMDDHGKFSQVPVHASFLNAVNARIADINRRSQQPH